MLICSENRSKISRIQPCQCWRNYGTMLLYATKNHFVKGIRSLIKKARRLSHLKKWYSEGRVHFRTIRMVSVKSFRKGWFENHHDFDHRWIAKVTKFLGWDLLGKFWIWTNTGMKTFPTVPPGFILNVKKSTFRMVEMSHFPLFFHKSIKKIYPPWN